VEQHKVLLIIVSVTMVLAAIVGVGLWLFYPRAADDADLAQDGTPESGGYEWQPLDYLQGQGDVPGLDEGEDGVADDLDEPEEFQVTYGVVPGAADSGATPGQTVIDTVDRAPVVETTEVSGADTSRVSADPARTTTADMADTPAARETGTTGPSPAIATVPSTTTAIDDPDLADRAYWIQAISSPNRDTAEQAQLTLREYQLGSLILTKVIDGRTYYRLRVGPFAVRAEAEKFLGWVQEINDFSDAMIFVDYTTPVLAARPN